MTREEAKEAIKEAYGTSEYTDEIIKALSAEPQEWISVKKKGNPTRSDEYWVTVRHTTFESVEKDYYSTTFGSWESGNEIIAWQPIIEPSPYKGE